MAPPRPLHCGIDGSLVSRPWRHLAARCTGSVKGPPVQTANDSGVWGVAGGEGVAREKTGPSQRCLGQVDDSGCPPPAGGQQKVQEAQGRGGSWSSARPAGQTLRKGRAANNCSQASIHLICGPVDFSEAVRIMQRQSDVQWQRLMSILWICSTFSITMA